MLVSWAVPEGPDPRSQDPPHGRPRRGPPDRVLRLRGRHPREAVRGGRRHRLGLGHVGARGPDARRHDRDPERRAQVHPPRREAQGPVHDRPDQPAPGQRPEPGVRGRRGRPVAAHPQARRGRAGRVGRRGPPAEREDAAGRTTTSRPTATPSGTARRPRPRRRSTSPAPSTRPCRSPSSRCSPRSPTKPFSDPDWLYEIKWDGYRVQAVVAEGKVRIWTRNLNDAETYFPKLLAPPSWIDARQAIVDGEVVALDEDGRPDFSLLQTKLGGKRRSGLVYQAFDLLYLDGRSLLDVPLEDRKRLLRSVLQGASAGPVRRPRRRRRRGLLRGRRGQRRRGRHRQAPPVALRARPADECLAEAQDPPGAGAGGRRLDAGGGECARPRGARGRRLRGRQAALQRQGRVRVHGRHPQGPPGQTEGRCDGRGSAVRSAAAEGLPRPLGR